jgi:protein-L-isoaspartate(D-aspartate) O-methyltransferase
MNADLSLYRQFFAEEIQVVANLKSAALVDALANVPRERYLRRGPWSIRAEADVGGGVRLTPDADPRHVYHNVSIAIDAERQLFNGAPGIGASFIDQLAIEPGHRVLHVGAGLGYYSAILARLVGSSGAVVAIEVDEALAGDASANLADYPWVEARHGDGTDLAGSTFDAILVSAGTTHPHEAWLRALTPRGRLILPLTCTMPQMGTLGKGLVVVISRAGADPQGACEARVVVPMIAIYSAVGTRDPGHNERLGTALMRRPWPRITRLRRDAHQETASCWFHGETFCFDSA